MMKYGQFTEYTHTRAHANTPHIHTGAHKHRQASTYTEGDRRGGGGKKGVYFFNHTSGNTDTSHVTKDVALLNTTTKTLVCSFCTSHALGLVLVDIATRNVISKTADIRTKKHQTKSN